MAVESPASPLFCELLEPPVPPEAPAPAAPPAPPGAAGARAVAGSAGSAAARGTRARSAVAVGAGDACDAIATGPTGAVATGAVATGPTGPSSSRGGPVATVTGCTAGSAGAAGASVARVGRGVATATGVGVAAPTAVTTVGRLAAAGLDAAQVRCVTAGRRVVALVVGVHRGGVAAVRVLIDAALGLVRGVDVDVGLVRVDDRAAVVAERAGIASRDSAGGRRACGARRALALGGSVVAGVDVPTGASGAVSAKSRCRRWPSRVPDVATPVWTTVAFWIDAWTFAFRESLSNPLKSASAADGNTSPAASTPSASSLRDTYLTSFRHCRMDNRPSGTARRVTWRDERVRRGRRPVRRRRSVA